MSSQGKKIDEMLSRLRQPDGLSPTSTSSSPTSDTSPNRRNPPVSLGNMDLLRRPPHRPNALHISATSKQQIIETDIKLKEIMKISGKLTINNSEYNAEIKDMEQIGDELGHGTCGHVFKMRHNTSGEIIAVKQMRRSGNSEENKRIIMDIDVVLKSHDCEFIVQCFGCFITESEVWICMELMATCFDKLLKKLRKPIPEKILGKVTVATVEALSYLKDKQGVMHRDVKPSNILLDERGNIKLCDFGISGRLVDSFARTRSAGCAAYMAPERIEQDPANPNYDVRADVWSLGITLVELATGIFPYQDCKNDFEVLAKVVNQDPPELPSDRGFSKEFQDFVSHCLRKQHHDRPKYNELKKHSFIRKYETEEVDVGQWYVEADRTADRQNSTTSSAFSRIFTTHQSQQPAAIDIKSHPPSLPNGGGDNAKDWTPPTLNARPSHNSRLSAYQSLNRCRNASPLTFPEANGDVGGQPSPRTLDSSNNFRAYSNFYPYVPLPQTGLVQEQVNKFNSPVLQRRLLDGQANTSPYPQKRGVSESRWKSQSSSTEESSVHGNTSPIVLQRFYHQQKQQQMAKEAEDGAKCNGKKRFTAYFKLQLSGDRNGRSSRHQSPEPPPRSNRMNGDSPLSIRRNLLDSNAVTSPNLSRRYVSPTPPTPPPRRLSESSSVPGSPQHLRTRFQYTPEPHRRFLS